MAMSMFGRGIATKGSGSALKVLQHATNKNTTFKVSSKTNIRNFYITLITLLINVKSKRPTLIILVYNCRALYKGVKVQLLV